MPATGSNVSCLPLSANIFRGEQKDTAAARCASHHAHVIRADEPSQGATRAPLGGGEPGFGEVREGGHSERRKLSTSCFSTSLSRSKLSTTALASEASPLSPLPLR